MFWELFCEKCCADFTIHFINNVRGIICEIQRVSTANAYIHTYIHTYIHMYVCICMHIYIYIGAVKLGSGPMLPLLKVRLWTNSKLRFSTKIILSYFYCGFKLLSLRASLVCFWGLLIVIGQFCENRLL